MKKRFYKVIIILAAVGIAFACSRSRLDTRPQGNLNPETIATRDGVELLLVSTYAMLDGYSNADGVTIGSWSSAADNWVYGSIVGGDAHKGSFGGDQPDINSIENYAALPTNTFFNEKWRAVYEGVNRANIVLKIMKEALDDISADDQKRIEGEARFLRAHYHFEAKKMWNNVPYISDTLLEFTVPNDKVNLPNTADIWPQIQADLQFAWDNLPAIQGAVGRANKWAAGAMLAKCLVFQKKWTEAMPILRQVYDNGTNALGVKYALLPRYQDNFNAATKNNSESVFAVQSSVNDGSNGANGNYGDVLNAPYGGPFDCCGFFQPSQDLVNSYKVNANGLPLIDNYNAAPMVTSDEGVPITQPFTPYGGTLDSRLDWTVGRRGIPYLDFGPHQGVAWQREQTYGGPYNTKKHVYYKSQKGALTDASFWASTTTAININLIRFADVILWLAECEIEAGDPEEARTLVNLIRARAASPQSFVLEDGSSSPAADYEVGEYPGPWTDQAEARKALHFERKLELAMEGHRFFDLVRWGEAGAELNKYIAYESQFRTYMQGATFTENQDSYFPIPQRQIDLSNGMLTQNPNY